MTATFDRRTARWCANLKLHVAMFDSEEEAEEACERVKRSDQWRALRAWMDGQFDRPGSGGDRKSTKWLH